MKINAESAAELNDYKAVEKRVKSFLVSVERNSDLNAVHGKVKYIRGIERAIRDYHVHIAFVFDNGLPDKYKFKELLKSY